MIPFPSHAAPGLAAWGGDIEQRLRQLETPQGPTPLWSCPAASLPPAAGHPNAAVKIAETGAVMVSTLVAGAWTWIANGPRRGAYRALGASGQVQQSDLFGTIALGGTASVLTVPDASVFADLEPGDVVDVINYAGPQYIMPAPGVALVYTTYSFGGANGIDVTNPAWAILNARNWAQLKYSGSNAW